MPATATPTIKVTTFESNYWDIETPWGDTWVFVIEEYSTREVHEAIEEGLERLNLDEEAYEEVYEAISKAVL